MLTRLLRGVLASFVLGDQALAIDVEHLVVLELFQSQGCSSCPPASAQVLAIAGRPNVLAELGLTYWD